MKMRKVLAIMVVVSAAVAQSPAEASVAAMGETAQYQRSGSSVDRMIERAFQDTLRRAPDASELRRYRVRVDEDHWNEDDIADDLRSRRDHMSHGDRTTRDRDSYDVDRIIRNAYQDVLGRAPDAEGLRTYRRNMIDDGWTERQVRDALRKSQEHASNPGASADCRA